MFCKFCGSPTEGDATVCARCAQGDAEKTSLSAAEQPPVQQQPQAQPQTQPQAQPAAPLDRMYGFKPALASTIVGVVGYVLVILAMVLAPAAVLFVGSRAGMIILLILAIAAGVVSLIFGVQSIQRFRRAKAQGVKPIATLVLGIVGTVSAAVVYLCAFISIILAISLATVL